MERKEYTQADADKEFKEYQEQQRKVIERASQFRIIHEDTVMIQRIDTMKYYTPLALDSAGEKMRKHEAFFGIVLFVSEIDSGDDVKESKKKLIKQGQVISFNADTPYSLNLKDHEYDIYVIHINNVLGEDKLFDCEKLYMENLKKKIGMPIY